MLYVERAEIPLGVFDLKVSFSLPEAQPWQSASPQEHDRLVTYGWRWNLEDGGAGHSWRLAKSPEDAIAQATESLEHQRFDTQEIFRAALCDVRITELSDSPTS